MNRERILSIVVFSLVLFVVIWFVGCAATGPSPQGETAVDDVADIDALLGLSDNQPKEEIKEDLGDAGDTIAEDDVLRILGVTEEKEPVAATSRNAETRPDVNNEIQKLVDEQKTLNTKESDLREKVAQQNDQITALTRTEEKPPAADVNRATPTWKSGGFSDRYQEALQAYRNRQYREAIQKFEILLADNTSHSLSDNCQYWIGESYWGLGNYQQAIVSFEKVFSFTKSNKEDAAQLKLGLCYMRLNDNERAKQEFQKLIDHYPNSEFVSSAKRAISQLE